MQSSTRISVEGLIRTSRHLRALLTLLLGATILGAQVPEPRPVEPKEPVEPVKAPDPNAGVEKGRGVMGRAVETAVKGFLPVAAARTAANLVPEKHRIEQTVRSFLDMSIFVALTIRCY